MRRISAAASLVLLGLVAVAVAEASVLALLVLFGLILKLRLGVEVGPAALPFGSSGCCPPEVTVFDGATIGSVLFTSGCGLGAAAWRFARWKRAA